MLRCPVLLILALLPGVPSVPAAHPVEPGPILASEFAERQVAPERAIDVHHLRLDLRVDFQGRRVAGEAALTLSPLAAPCDRVALHAAGLAVESVELAGAGAGTGAGAGAGTGAGTGTGTGTGAGAGAGAAPVDFALEPGSLVASLPRAYAPGESLTLRIRYSAAAPAGTPEIGLYFIAPDEAYARRPLQLWTQGETEENRTWFPGWDYPNDRATSEMVVTVPAGFTAVSNGALVARRENPDRTVTFHWSESRPHVSYLVSLVVGKLAHLTDKHGSVELDYYVPPHLEPLARRSFENTPDMIRVFEEAFGHPYPYEKYAQTAVADFRWGGMENVSATTLTERTLHDEAAHLTFRSDDLVSHELAHQWFGDMITCRSWSHIWLNESFATFAEIVYYEAKWGEDGLAEQLLGQRHAYLEEYKEDYRRAIVTDVYGEPEDMFDAHAYPKGSLVLHMLRNILDEELFWPALHHHVRKHAWQSVDTAQFRLALEEATGRDLTLFFDQWLYHGGHPVLEAAWSWDEKRKQVAIEVKQVQEVDALTPLFDTPLDIRITTRTGTVDRVRDERVRVDREYQVFHFDAEARPRFVQLDPRGWLLAEIEVEKPAAEWVLELGEAREVMGRAAAAAALGDFVGDVEAIAGLGRALREDPSRHVRGRAAEALGDLGTEGALEALAAGVADPDARVRREVAEALGSFRSERAGRLLVELIDRDPSPYVVADAAEALGHTRVTGALERLARAARRPAHDDVIARGAYAGMAALEDPAALSPLMRATRYGVSPRARAGAIVALGKLAKALPEKREEIRKRLVELVGDRHYDARDSAVEALRKSEDPEALPLLRQLARASREPFLRAEARGAVWHIVNSERASERELARRLEEVERTGRQLREDVERLKEKRPAPESGRSERR